mgnify:CR=1 FL=1
MTASLTRPLAATALRALAWSAAILTFASGCAALDRHEPTPVTLAPVPQESARSVIEASLATVGIALPTSATVTIDARPSPPEIVRRSSVTRSTRQLAMWPPSPGHCSRTARFQRRGPALLAPLPGHG